MGFLRKLFGKDVGTDVLEILASQHAEVDALIEKIEKRDGNRRVLFTELADKLAALGNEVLVMFEELMKSHPYKQVPAQTDAAAELPRR